MNRDPRCVFVADNHIHASLITAWLDQQGIAAQVVEQNSRGQFDLLTFDGQGVEVWVEDIRQADEAAKLLTAREWDRISRETADEVSDTLIPAICEECGRKSWFPFDQRGTCQNCAHCGAYIDVGGETASPADDVPDAAPPAEGIRAPSDLRRDRDR